METKSIRLGDGNSEGANDPCAFCDKWCERSGLEFFLSETGAFVCEVCASDRVSPALWAARQAYFERMVIEQDQLHLEDRDEPDREGDCPECFKENAKYHNDGYLNIGRVHFIVCHRHKVYWAIGANLFSAWRNETEDIWERNKKLLSEFRPVEAHHAPMEEQPRG